MSYPYIVLHAEVAWRPKKSTSRVSNSDFGPPMASSKSVINSSGDHVLKLRLHGRFAHARLDATAVRKRLPTRVGSLV